MICSLGAIAIFIKEELIRAFTSSFLISSTTATRKRTESTSMPQINQTKHSCDESNHQEWKEMVDGIALFFYQAPKRSIFRHELPQFLLLEHSDKAAFVLRAISI